MRTRLLQLAKSYNSLDRSVENLAYRQRLPLHDVVEKIDFIKHHKL